MWFGIFYYTFATLFAQLAITLRLVTTSCHLTPIAYHAYRVYAVTGKNRWIAFFLYFMSFVQVGLGVAGSVYSGSHPGVISFPSI